MNKKSTKKISAPITPEDMPVMYQAFHAGMKVMRYFNEPNRVKMAADPKNEMTRVNKTLIIILVIKSFLIRFFSATSVS
jgi:hypothetical protein